MRFREYLLAEQREYFVDKISDILTGVHEMLDAGKQISTKQQVRNAEYIANQIRKILHASWPRSYHKYLKVLQKCGVALLKAVEEKGDLPETFNSVRAELEELSGKLGEPINVMGSMTQEKPKKQSVLPPQQQAAMPAPLPPTATPDAGPPPQAGMPGQ